MPNPLVTNVLKNKLLSDFFTSATKVRARGFYTDSNGSNANLAGTGRNSIDLEMGVGPTAGGGDIRATRNPGAAATDYILIRIDDVNGYDGFRVDTLEFVNDAETVIYYEYDFSPQINFTNNGELYLEAVEFSISGT